MTAEIAILNRNGVALAADSAVTLQLPEGPKIYLTNKLFSLSKFHPVGIMVYGSADFMDVPWETIIKQYRSKLGRKSFPRLDQYAADFLIHLEKRKDLFPARLQKELCHEFVTHWLQGLINSLKQALRERLTSQSQVSEEEVRALFRTLVAADIAHLKRHKKLPRFSRTSESTLSRRIRKPIRDAIKDRVKKIAKGDTIRALENAAASAIVRDLYWQNESGIVIAGYGSSDSFPSLRSYKADLVVTGKLRYVGIRRIDISGDRVTASILPFAQSEMVALFMNGIDADFESFVRSFVARSLIDGYPSVISKILNKAVSRSRLRRLVRRLTKAGRGLSVEFERAVKEYEKVRHSDPVIKIVNHLPKEELAAMAEALVNLTSFKRHVTGEAETVGGPIDVAVISRGDGFIWIKRKHYFSRELNPQFLANYFENMQ